MNWINVEDKLPEDEEDVLVYHWEDDHITVGDFQKSNVSYYIESDGSKFYTNDGWDTEIPWAPKGRVTHWMPLPIRPFQAKDDSPKIALGRHDFPISMQSTSTSN